MGFAENTHQNFGKSSFSGGGSPFYSLRVSEKERSPESYEQFENGQQPIYGFHEKVWFLTPLYKAPLIKFHPTKGDDLVLCAKTWGEEGVYCPACEAFGYYQKQYGDLKTEYPIKATQQNMVIPVIVPRRQNGNHVYTTQTGQSVVKAIYWLEMKVTHYIPELQEHFNKLKRMNDWKAINTHPYMVFRKKTAQGERHEYWFKPVDYTQDMIVNPAEHPIIQNYISFNQQGIQNRLDQPMFDLLENLAVLRYKQYSDPSTGQNWAYDGHYEKALQAWESVKSLWPPAATRLAPPAPQQGFVPPTNPGAQPMQQQFQPPGQLQNPMQQFYQQQQQYQQPQMAPQQQGFTPPMQQQAPPVVPPAFTQGIQQQQYPGFNTTALLTEADIPF